MAKWWNSKSENSDQGSMNSEQQKPSVGGFLKIFLCLFCKLYGIIKSILNPLMNKLQQITEDENKTVKSKAMGVG